MSDSAFEDLDNLLDSLSGSSISTGSPKKQDPPSKNPRETLNFGKEWDELDALVVKHENEERTGTKTPSNSNPSESNSKNSDGSFSADSKTTPFIRTSHVAEDLKAHGAKSSSNSPARLKNNASNVLRRSTTSIMASGNPCGKCGIPVIGEHTIALNKIWHPEHFECGSCERPLVGDFFDHEGVINCRDCAMQKFRCTKCDQLIEGEYYITKDKRYHMDCVDMSLCYKCREAIVGSEMVALGRHYHPQCFKCSECDSLLPSKFFNRDGEPTCDPCMDRFEAAKLIRCEKCSKPVAGSYVSYEGKSYHDECFKCSMCQKNLPLDDFYNVKGRPSCFACASRANQ